MLRDLSLLAANRIGDHGEEGYGDHGEDDVLVDHGCKFSGSVVKGLLDGRQYSPD